MKTSKKIPKFRIHKATRQGFVELSGKRIYLGRADRPATKQKYHQLITVLRLIRT
jgi:hypothetical protein